MLSEAKNDDDVLFWQKLFRYAIVELIKQWWNLVFALLLVDRGRGEAPHQTPPDDVRTTGCRRDKNEVGRINYITEPWGDMNFFSSFNVIS